MGGRNLFLDVFGFISIFEHYTPLHEGSELNGIATYSHESWACRYCEQTTPDDAVVIA
jgi:hypothetical protein